MCQRLPQGPQPRARHRRGQEDGDGAPALIAVGATASLLPGFAGEPDSDGWLVRERGREDSFLDFYGRILVRAESARIGRMRLETHAGLRNIKGQVHGGYLLAVVDQALFAGPAACGFRVFGGATVNVSSQFLAPAVCGPAIDAVSEVLRETGRLLFVRGLIEQERAAVLAFSGTIRKPG